MKPILAYYDMMGRVTAFSTTRQGGCSQGHYATLNVNTFCGDDAAAVSRNRKSLCQLLGLEDDTSLIIPHQVHGIEIRKIDKEYLSADVDARKEFLEGVDAVMTQVPGVCIGVSTADCIPVLLYDEEHHCAAAVHAGWRGTVARIVEITIRRMTEEFGSQPQHMRAVIGPGISVRNFEVGQEVYDAFQQAGFDMSQIAVKYPMKWHVNLPFCNRLQMEKMGISSTNIVDSGICTYDHADKFFSARRLTINSGRIYTGIILH